MAINPLVVGGLLLLVLGIVAVILITRAKKCPEGQKMGDDGCEPECPEGQKMGDDGCEPECPEGQTLVGDVCKSAAPVQTTYTNKGPYRLLGGNSGWGFSMLNNKSNEECKDLCNKDANCKGYTSTSKPISYLEDANCLLYNKGQDPTAWKASECKDDPGSVDVCRRDPGILGTTLYWKN